MIYIGLNAFWMVFRAGFSKTGNNAYLLNLTQSVLSLVKLNLTQSILNLTQSVLNLTRSQSVTPGNTPYKHLKGQSICPGNTL